MPKSDVDVHATHETSLKFKHFIYTLITLVKHRINSNSQISLEFKIKFKTRYVFDF
jgi:hypothetical protein